MTDPTHRTDAELRRLFEQSRRADRSKAPGFHSMIEASRDRRLRRLPGRAFVLLAAAGGVSAVLAVWMLRTIAPVDSEISGDAGQITVASAKQPPDSLESAQVPVAGPAPMKQEIEGKAAEPLGRPSRTVPSTSAPPSPSPLLAQGSAVTKEALIQNLPVQGRYYQNVLTLAPGAPQDRGDLDKNALETRPGDFKVVVSGVAKVDPRTGPPPPLSPAVSIEEVDLVAAAAANTESYAPIRDNEFLSVKDHPLSTFSIDVDTASYANVRRFLKAGQLPPRDAVRIEELINYFPYSDPAPTGDAPFASQVELASCPWDPAHRLARVSLKGREVARGATKGSNLVFLIDVSGSMNAPNKLPLVRSALTLLANELDGRDDVAIVVYAGASGVVLPPTPGSAQAEIRAALERLSAGGGTNGGEGLRAAYNLAREHFIPGGVNRVILATDGDFNLGVTTQAELLALIEADARRGIALTALGFGMGNYKDSTLELLADRGDGNYAYIDDLREARKVLVEEIGGTLVTIAKDVKIQVEFNPAEVAAYRLIGYENRLLRAEEFNDDRKDAGEIGSGHTVTALYEIVPAGERAPGSSSVDPLKYQSAAAPTDAAGSGEMFTLKLRYKEPDGDKSRLISVPVVDAGRDLGGASADLKFAAAVAEFGLALRDPSRGDEAAFDRIRGLAAEGARMDPGGYRAEFLDLVERARGLRAAAPGLGVER